MSSRPARLFAVLFACVGLAVGLAACGGDGDDDKQGSIALTELPGNPESGSDPGRPSDGRLAQPDADGEAESEAPADGGATGETDGGATDGGGANAANAEGKAIFTQSCAGCHTLADAAANGSVGPNLDETKPGEAAVAAKVRSGGGGMPSFGGQLEPGQIDAVAAYVAETAGS